MFRKIIKWFKCRKLSLASKMILGLSSIVVILLLSSVISILEYRRMSNYVTDLIATNIHSINISRKLANAADNYNLKILEAIGTEIMPAGMDAENKLLKDYYDDLVSSVSTEAAVAWADSVAFSYTSFILKSLDLEQVLMSDFVDTRSWYFEELQPCYNKLKDDIESLNEVIYWELHENSETFQAGFYRSIMPGVVSIGAGIMLVLLFLTFTLIYYVRPLRRMLRGVNDYRSIGRRYGYDFDGNDELVALNDGLKDIIDENVELKRRVNRLKEGASEPKDSRSE